MIMTTSKGATAPEGKVAGPRPANGGLPTPGRIVLVAGGEEAGSVETAVPAIVVRSYEVGENDSRGYKQGTYRADLVVFNAHGSAATAYPDTPMVGNDEEAREWLEDGEAGATRRTPDDTSPARRAVVAFWPTRS